MQQWLVILGDQAPAEWVLSTRQMAFRGSVGAERVRAADRLALYISRNAFHNPGRDESQIVAIGCFATAPAPLPVSVAGTAYPLSCRLEFESVLPPRQGLAVRPLIERLAFIAKKESWSAYVRRTLVPLPEKDFVLIKREFVKLVAAAEKSAPR